MTIIKFRGLSKSSKEWVIGNLIQRTNEFIFPAGVYTTKIYDCLIEIYPETRGQYIGLMDANGTDIYTGDIVKGTALVSQGGFDYLGVVEFITQNTAHGFQVIEPMRNGFAGGWSIDQLQTKISLDHITGEVIGNIYENPELLEEVRK